MHDIQTLDRRGVPGGAVATVAFREAAEAQSKALGFNPAMAWVPHPIQNRTPDELADVAEQAIDNILALISPAKGD
ncbi:MAG: hypothetical protein HOM25_02295 [Rhodospirillaceae bacterium]|nr:hypothetical protein [Rhodospirillaceae bacterium]MBT5811290.1 hypothetical protein [Rhodospirillaceae bacterium]